MMFPWKSKNLYFILLTSLSAVMGVSLLSPALPDIREAFQVNDVQVGYVVTLYTLPAIFLAPIAGLLVDRYGRKSVLVPSLLVFGTSGLIIVTVQSFTLILCLRTLQGIGGVSLALIARTLIGDVYSGRTRQSAMGLNDAVLAIGAAIFPFLGGYMAKLGWYFPFYLYGLPVIASVFVALYLDRIEMSTSKQTRHYLRRGIKLLNHRHTLFLLGGTLLAFLLLYGTMNTSVPLYLEASFNYDSSVIGRLLAYMALTIALVSLLNGPLSKRYGNCYLLLSGFSLYGLGLVLIGWNHTYQGLLAGFLTFGLGHGLTLPTLNTELVSDLSKNRRGAIMAYRTICSRMGQTIGPIVFPAARFWIDYPLVFVTVGTIFITLALLALLVTSKIS